MKAKFNISGCYYNYMGQEFRKALDIVRVQANTSEVELIVIMMNPGSSRPSKNDNLIVKNLKSICEINAHVEFVEAIPDKTQEKIMGFMNLSGINYARILNISDLKEAKSGLFYSRLKTMDNVHSIFSPVRKDDLLLPIGNQPCLLAWGCSSNITFNLLKLNAICWLGSRITFGYHPIKDSQEYFYHPLARKNHLQVGKTWEELIYERWLQYNQKVLLAS